MFLPLVIPNCYFNCKFVAGSEHFWPVTVCTVLMSGSLYVAVTLGSVSTAGRRVGPEKQRVRCIVQCEDAGSDSVLPFKV